MQGENNNAFNRAMKAGGDDSENAQPYIERSRNNDISKDEDSLAVLSAKQLTNNVGRIFWTKTPTIQMRTTKRFKTPDSSAARTPQMNQVKLVKQALSPDTIIEEAKPATTTNTGGEHKIVVEKLEKITKDLELNPKEKNVANPKVLEAWVNETLLEVERVEHSDQNIPWERKQPLRRFGIDRQSLEGSGMSKDRIDRLYRCLFVYSAGFYEFINEMFEHSPNKFNLVGSVWKVFWILLEYCYKSEHQTILDEINKENKEHLERLFKELQKKEKEIKDLELWKEINFANVQRDLEQMRLDKENLLKEKMHLEEDVKINEKAYSDEVQLRIKFENKINDFYANYHDLKVKNTRILEELVVQNRKSEDLAKENSEFRVKNARANEKIIELEGTLKVTLEKLASREATINELTHDKEVIEKKLIDSFKANQTVDLNKLQASFQNANFKLETSSTLNEMYQKNLVELEKLIATKNKDIAYLEERYKTLEKAHEEKCKEALETEKERIKYFDLSNLLQEKLDITTKNLDQRNLEYDELLKDYSSLKHLLNAEREKLEALTEERNAAEENVITLNRVRSQKDEEIAKLEKTLAEEYERMSEMQSQIDDLSREKERLEVVTQEQKQLINDYEEKMKESEVMMTNIKSDMFSNEDHMSKLMNKEKTNQQSIMNKLEEEQEKSKMFQLDIIQLKQVVETGVQERHKCNLKIQDLETQLEAVIKAKEEIQETINGYSTKKDEIEAEKIHEKHAWDLAKNDFEKKINELEKVIEELTAPRERTYHPLVVEDLLSRISRLDLQVTGFESRHYDDLRKLTEANGKIKQAKKIHTQLHALSQKLLKDNVKLQEELENKAFETQRLKALTDFLQQRQEILTMQILDQKEQLKEATPKVKEDGEEGKSALEKPLKGNLGPSLLKKEKEPARSNSSPKKRTDPPQASTFAKASAALQRDSPKHDTDQKDAKTDSLKESISQKDSRLNTSESIDRKSIGPNTSIHIKPNSRPNLNPSPSSGGHSITDQIEKIVKTEKVEKKIPSQTRGLTRESRRSERSFEDKKENERSITKSNESKKSGLTANGSRAAQEFLAGIDYVKRELLNSQNSERSNVSRRNFEKLDTSKDGSVDERKSREESPEVRKVGSLLKERQSSQSIINRDVKSPLSGVKTEKPKSPQEKPVLKPKEPTRAISPVGIQDEKSPGQRKGSPSPPIRPEEREQTPESIRTAGSRHHIKNIPSVEEEKNVSSSSSSDSSSSSERGGSRDRSISSKGTKRSSKKYGRNSKPGSRNKTRGPTGSKEFLTVGNQDKQPIQQRVSFRIEDGSQSPREASPSDGPIFVEEQQHSSQERSHFSRPISVNTDKIQPILMGSDHADEFNKTGESLSKFDRLQATGDFPAIGRAERTIEDTLSPSPSPGNITLDEVDAFYEQQLNIDQIIQIATQQTLNTNKQQSPSYLNLSPSGKPRGEDTFNATFNSLRSQLRPAFTGGDNLTMLANQNDLLQDASTIRDGERPSTKSAFDQSFYNSSMKGTIEKSSKSALAPLQKGRPSSQPFENEKTQNKLKEILQGRPGTTQNVVSPLGALHDRARIPTISSQQSHDDGEQSQRVDSQGQPRSITALPPLKQIPPKQLQRGETGNSATFSSSSKKSIERKRQYSIKEGGMQRLESKKSNVSQESSPASSVNMSFQTKSGQRAPTRDLNRTYDVVLDSSLVNSRSESIPEDTRPSARRASGIQVISELDSQRSSLPSTTPVQKAHRAGSLKVPERREKSMKTIEDDDAREQTEEDDKLRRKQKTVSYHKSKTYTLPQTSGQESEYNDQEATDRDQGQDPPALDSEMRALIDALANRVQIEAKEEQMKPKIDLRSLVNKVKGSLTGPKPHNRSPGADRSSKRGSPSYKK